MQDDEALSLEAAWQRLLGRDLTPSMYQQKLLLISTWMEASSSWSATLPRTGERSVTSLDGGCPSNSQSLLLPPPDAQLLQAVVQPPSLVNIVACSVVRNVHQSLSLPAVVLGLPAAPLATLYVHVQRQYTLSKNSPR